MGDICPSCSKKEKETEEISGKSESNPGTPEVEAELEEAVDEVDVEEVKPEGRKTTKKKRTIAPIRIKLTKTTVSQKLHKSLVNELS